MRRRAPLYFALLLAVAAVFLGACRGAEGPAGPVGPAGAPGPVGPPGPPGEDASASQAYVGADRCADCHEEIAARFTLSGHAHPLTAVDGAAPSFPYDDVTGGIPAPPDGYEWSDISYVVGGFGWMARFVDQDGYVITGDAEATTQYNFAYDRIDAPAGWVPYHAGEEPLLFTCGECHTTGYQPQGHQDGMEGIVGTWAEAGVNCERCHGPGSRHAADPQGVQMVIDRNAQLCGDCHVRDNPAVLAAADGFEEHNQQYSDLFNSKHFALSCVTCHDPHASSVYADEQVNPTAGIRQTCDSCHWQNLTSKNNRHANVRCVDCHMPPMAKSAQGDLDLHIADVRSHQFSINTDPEAPQFSEDGSTVMPYITLTYACQQCHNGQFGVERPLEELADMAQGYHSPVPTPTATPEPTPEETPSGTPEATATASP